MDLHAFLATQQERISAEEVLCCIDSQGWGKKKGPLVDLCVGQGWLTKLTSPCISTKPVIFACLCDWLIKTTFVFKHYLGTGVGRIMAPQNVHILIPKLVNMLYYMAKGH